MGRLRRILAEAGDLDQALAGVQGPGEEQGQEDWQKDAEATANKRPVQRFFGKKFNDDAVKLYKNLSVPIYVVPVWSFKPSDLDGEGVRVSAGEDAQGLQRYGLSPDRAEALEQARASGAAIFVVQVARLDKGNLPTPWMIVHAMFDTQQANSPVLGEMWMDVYRAGSDEDEFVNAFEEDDGELMQRALTMKSARDGQIRAYTDAIAEILTQAVLTTSGFRYNETGDPRMDSLMANVARVVAPARQEFEAQIAGKVLTVGVHLLN